MRTFSEKVRYFITHHNSDSIATAIMLRLYSEMSRYLDRGQLISDEKIFLRFMQKGNANLTRQFAAFSYGRAYEERDNIDISKGTRILRQMLKESNFDTRLLAAYALARLNRELGDEEVNDLAKFLDEALIYPKTRYRYVAVAAYGLLAKRLSREEAKKLAGRFEAMMQDKNNSLAKHAVLAYKEFLLRTGGAEGIKAIRNMMNSEDKEILELAIWAYADLCERVDNTYLPKDAGLLRRMINSGKSHYVREIAIKAYGKLGDRFDATEAELGSKLLKEIAVSDPDNRVREFAVTAYISLIHKLNADELAEAAKILERLATDPASNKVRMEASIAYEKVTEEAKRRTTGHGASPPII